MNHPIVIEAKGTELYVPEKILQQLLKKPKAILWCNAGLYGWVPIEQIINALQSHKDRAQTQLTVLSHPLKFTWAEVVEIPAVTGRVIKKYNGGKKQ